MAPAAKAAMMAERMVAMAQIEASWMKSSRWILRIFDPITDLGERLTANAESVHRFCRDDATWWRVARGTLDGCGSATSNDDRVMQRAAVGESQGALVNEGEHTFVLTEARNSV